MRFVHDVPLIPLLFLVCVGVVQAESSLSQYRLSSGDLVNIRVFGEEELTLETRLSDTGTISYPLLGELRVVGKTTGQLESVLIRKLKNGYLVDPNVSVSVSEYRKFFVNGEVQDPGGFPYLPGLTVQKAVSFAGGFSERASKRNIYILREGDDDGKPAAVALNCLVKPGDILAI